MAERKGRARAAAPDGDGEIHRILNVLPSQDVERDFTFENALQADIATAAAPPPSKDLRESWWKIGDQGSTGSCVGWATADSLMRWNFVKTNRIRKTDILSVRFVWMAAKETDEFASQPTTFVENAGTSLKAALDVVRKYGNLLDADLPFGTGALYPGDERTLYAKASQLKIASYINLGSDLGRWRNWLAFNGPILTRLNVDATWMGVGADGRLATYQDGTGRGGHAVSLVGYDAGAFIVRNSWGERWGDKGFAYASNTYAARAFTEAYGVTAT